MFGRNKLAALVAEFLGTGILTFVVLNVGRSALNIPYFIAFAAGLAIVLVGVALARDVQLNPAYTLALWTARKVKTSRALAYIIVQLLGAWAAYALYKYFMHDQPIVGASSTYEGRVLVAEVVGTFVFAFVAVGALYQQAHWAVRGALLGAAYTIGVIIASVSSAGFINPAVALGSNSLVWGTYILGPVLGAVIGVNLYGLLFAPVKVATSKAKVTVKKVKK
jgi:glycerol uptake facilitator-like aquaporin